MLKILGFTLMGAAPFVVSYLLLPSDARPQFGRGSSEPDLSHTAVLEFPFPAAPAPPFTPEPAEPAASPPQTPPSPSPRPPQCANGRDDDEDRRIDRRDPGCSSGNDNSERTDPVSPPPSPTSPAPIELPDPSPSPSPEPPPPSNCSDSQDNDGDGLSDGADPGCGDGNELPVNQTGPAPGGRGEDPEFPDPVIPLP